MKSIIIAILVVVKLYFTTAAQSPEKKSFQISVTVENLKGPGKIILTVRDINQWVEYTAESGNGKFMVSGSVREPSFAYLTMKYGNEFDKAPRMKNITQLFVDNDVIKIQTKDSLNVAVINGGAIQKELEQLTASLDEKASVQKRQEVIGAFIEQHPTSFVSIYGIQNFSMDHTFSVDADHVEPLFQKLSPEIKNTLSGKELGKDIRTARETAIGSIAPEFIQKDTVDRNVSLSSFRGRYVLIDFWASWCKPCRQENPMLVKTFKEYEGKNFTIVSVSLDNSKVNWIKAIHKDQLTWTHTSDLKFWKNEVALLYGVKTVPQNYLLDPTGKIIGKNIPSAELGKLLEQKIH